MILQIDTERMYLSDLVTLKIAADIARQLDDLEKDHLEGGATWKEVKAMKFRTKPVVKQLLEDKLEDYDDEQCERMVKEALEMLDHRTWKLKLPNKHIHRSNTGILASKANDAHLLPN